MPADRPALPDDHLALIVEDLLNAISEPPMSFADNEPLVGVLLYAWAIGLTAPRDIADRAGEDEGIAYLSGASAPTAQALHALVQRDRAHLEALFADVFDLCQAAGLQRLGWIELSHGDVVDRALSSSRILARSLLARSAAGSLPHGAAALPVAFQSRASRQELLRSVHATRASVVATLTTVATSSESTREPQTPNASAMQITRALVAGAAILAAGLLAVRWVGTSFATPPPPKGSAARFIDSSAGSIVLRQADDPEEQVATEVIRQEAFRLAREALVADDLEAARDLYVLAEAVVPGDPEALQRWQQVETALGIASRRDGWEAATADLADLRLLAPDSKAVLAAYVDSLIAASREALATGARERALAFCRDAVTLMPAHPGARACAPSGTSGPAGPTLIPPTLAPTTRPTPIPLTPAPPLSQPTRA